MAGYFVFESGNIFYVGYIMPGERFEDDDGFSDYATALRFIATLEPLT